MSTESTETPTTPAETPEVPPLANPRLAIMKDIAARSFEQHAKDAAEGASVPSVDDDHNITPAPSAPQGEPEPAPAVAASEEPPATPSAEPSSESAPAGAPSEEAINPEADYTVIVEGQQVVVKGKTIIDAGKRTLQKEAAADHRLQLASRLLEEAQRRSEATPDRGAPPPAATPQGMTEEQLANALQFGTPQESAAAVRQLREGGISEERILQLTEERARLVAADEFEFRRGQAVLHREFKDLMERPALRRLFESEDARLLQEGDRRPYVTRYRSIGEQLRKDFGIQRPQASAPSEKPQGSAAARQVAKAQAPTVPRTAAARLGEGGGDTAKPVQPSDVIAGMAAARGKNRLTDPPKPNRR